MEKLEKMCILNFVFKMIAAAGIIGIFVIAGLSDADILNNAHIFSYGTASLLLSSIGIWGYLNCTRIIDSYKKSYNRRKVSIQSISSNYRAA